MLDNQVRNCGSISILSIRILGVERGISSYVTEGQNWTPLMDRRALDGQSWGLSHQFHFIFSECSFTTFTTVLRALDGLYCTTLVIVRDFLSKSPINFLKFFMTVRHHGPSCSLWSVNWSVVQHINHNNIISVLVLCFCFLFFACLVCFYWY